MDVHGGTGPPAPARYTAGDPAHEITTVGLPIIFIIPILALFGVFGERYVKVAARRGGVAVTMRYPNRIHYRQSMPLRITVWNASTFEADSVRVALDPKFMRAFSAISLTPAPNAATQDAFTHVASSEATQSRKN